MYRATVLWALMVFPLSLQAQAVPISLPAARPPQGGLYLTAFRSPSTGLEYRRGALAVNAGWYPTIIKADGQTESENTNFVRIGFSAYLRSHGITPFISPGLLLSLDDDWDNGIITEAGVRFPVARWLALRGGVGVITSFDGEVRVNPTVGFDIRLGLK